MQLESLEDRTVPTAGIGLNFTGNTFANSGGVAPPDTQGDVGPNHIVNFTNGSFAIFNKTTGSLISRTSDSTFWTTKVGVAFTVGLSDPRILFDWNTQRWFACEIDLKNTGNLVLLGRSDTSDPTGNWEGTSFVGSPTGFADYPTFGIDADAIYVGVNNFSGASGVSLFSIPKASILAATPTTANMTSFLNMSANTRGFTLQGAVNNGTSNGHGSIVAIDNDTFGLTRFNVNGNTGAGATLTTTVTIPIASYSGNPDARQPDGTAQIDTLDDRISGNAYQVGNLIYLAHTVGISSRAHIRVYVLNEATNAVVATATIGDAVRDFYQPTIAANSLGNVVVGYNRSGNAAGEFISSYASIGTLVGSTLTFEAPFQVRVGAGNYHLFGGSGERWGDYSAVRVDPSNPSTFWSFQEFVNSTNSYATAISQLNVVNTTLTLNGSNNLVIAETAPNGKNDALTIQSDNANSRFVITDPVNFLGTTIAGATGNGTHTVTIPFASVAGTSLIVNTGAGTDSVTVDNSLGAFTKSVSVDGGSGTDSVVVNGTNLGDAMTISGGSTVFGTVNVSYTTVENVNVDGGAGADTFNLTPSATLPFTINGGSPVFPSLVSADFLVLNLAGVTGQALAASGNGAGTWSFTNRSSIAFSSIERMTPGVSISGRVFQDLDGDGSDDGGSDPGMVGETVNLDSLADGTEDLIATTIAGGAYTFADLAPGSYRIRQVIPSGFTQSSVNPADLTFSSPLTNVGVNFGNFVADLTPPTIVSVQTISPNPRNTAVGSIQVSFSELISLATFTLADLSLTRNGSPVSPFSGDESFTQVGATTTYVIGGLTQETSISGNYLLTVFPGGINDLAGNPGVGGNGTTSWTADFDGPIVLSTETISSPRITPVATIDVVFDQPIDLATFTNLDLTLLRNGSPVVFNNNETFTLVSGNTYRVGGLADETTLAGNYSFTVSGAAIADALGNNGGGSGNSLWTTNPSDAIAPTIVGVFFDGSAWSSSFRTAVGNASFGFPAQTGATQFQSMPWNTVNTIYVEFSEAVTTVDSTQVGVRGIIVPTYVVSNVTMFSATIAKIEVSAPFDTDRIVVALDGSTGSAIVDLAGNKLAGTFNDGDTLPSTGPAGVDFKFRFVVAVGDVDRNGQVRNSDLNAVRNNLFIDVGTGGYSVFADIDGNGLTRNADLNATRNHLFVDAPSGPGPNRPNNTGRGGVRANGGAAPTAAFNSSAAVVAERTVASARRIGSTASAATNLDALFADF